MGERSTLPGWIATGIVKLFDVRLAFGRVTLAWSSLSRHLDARFLSPNPKRVSPSTAILNGGHQVAPRSEVAIDHGMRGEEPLCLSGRFEALHLPLSPASRPMRAFSSVIEVSAAPVPGLGQDLTVRNAVAAKAIRDDPPRFVSQANQQAFEEAPGRRGVASVLHQNIEHDAMLIDSPPEIAQLTIDTQIHLIEVPDVARLRSTTPELAGELGPEPETPLPDTFVSDQNTAFGEDQFDIAQAQAEDVIQPDGVADDLGWEAVSGIGDKVGRHPISVVQTGHSG